MSIVYNGMGARGKKPPKSDTSYSSLTRGVVATVGSVGVEGAEGGEERKELSYYNIPFPSVLFFHFLIENVSLRTFTIVLKSCCEISRKLWDKYQHTFNEEFIFCFYWV
jgi:hypothetical protein